MSLPDPEAGPSGTAPLPPEWLAARALPLVRFRRGTRFFRVHRVDHDAVFFGPAIDPETGQRPRPTHRFDSLTGAFGVLYLSKHLEGAFAETLLRNPQRRFVSETNVVSRAVSELTCDCDLKLVDLRSRGLSHVGTTNAISTGPYTPCWTWSDYLWSHRDQPDGIAYASRHNPRQICYAIFERPGTVFTAAAPTVFAQMMPMVKELLRRYEKILVKPHSR